MEQEKKMRPIWYFVGLMLVAMGGIITASGIYRFIAPTDSRTVLAELHPDLWWGALMVVAGSIFLLANRKASVE